MSFRILRAIVAPLIVLAMACTTLALLPALNQSTTAWAQGGGPETAKTRKLAAATGASPAHLQLAGEAPLTLLNGQRLVRLKAIDQATGETVSAAFDGDRAVDEAAMRAEAATQWRSQHGALTPGLVQKLAALQPDDKLDVVLWLAAEVTPLPRPERRPPANEAINRHAPASQAATAGPVPPSQVPADVRERLALSPAVSTLASQPGAPKSPAEIEQRRANAGPAVLTSTLTAQQAQAFGDRNLASLRAQIAPVRGSFLDQLRAQGLAAQYASETAPMVYLEGVTRQQVEELARLPGIDAIYDAPPNVAGPALSTASPAQNADLISEAGYTGSGVKVAVVEGQRVYTANPYLAVTAVYSAALPAAHHSTEVAGVIKSAHPTYKGLAPDALLYSANGSYTDFGVMSAALDWGAANAKVLNSSYYWENGSSIGPFELDRHMDYLVRYNLNFAAVAAGNFARTGCPTTTTLYVSTPGQGYNALTVGNYDDDETLSWSDDAMNYCSSFGDPGHAKPEVAAIGTNIVSTIASSSSPYFSSFNGGTSFSSPMVAALAADLIGADSSLALYPEALRSIIMATALHNVEGDARLSDEDGVGAIDASAALATLERGDWADQFIDASTAFPLTYSVYAYQGERVRFVVNWLSNPTAGYVEDPLPADLDLEAYRADGTTLITFSTSISNNFEIVDFVAPASETYLFKVILTSASWSGGGTQLSAAWWRGVDRLSPDTGYSYSSAPPLGAHLAIYPTDWSPTGRWHGLAIRPDGSDHDLELFSASKFDDPDTRASLASSSYGSGEVDLIMVDGNHRPAGQPEQYVVARYAGGAGYAASWSNLGVTLSAPGLYGPYNMGADEVVKVFDVQFSGGITKEISIVPATDTNDLAAELFLSNDATPSTWTLPRDKGVALADTAGVGDGVEKLSYNLDSSSPDVLGLAVYSKVRAPAQFWINIADSPASTDTVYLPIITK
jgi:hypothetical protein